MNNIATGLHQKLEQIAVERQGLIDKLIELRKKHEAK